MGSVHVCFGRLLLASRAGLNTHIPSLSPPSLGLETVPVGGVPDQRYGWFAIASVRGEPHRRTPCRVMNTFPKVGLFVGERLRWTAFGDAVREEKARGDLANEGQA